MNPCPLCGKPLRAAGNHPAKHGTAHCVSRVSVVDILATAHIDVTRWTRRERKEAA